MLSPELVEYINKDRLDNGVYTSLSHADFMKKARRILSADTIEKEMSTYINSRGKEYPCLDMSSETCNVMRASYSIDRPRIYAERESGALSAIEQLTGSNIDRQYQVGIYSVDGYDKENNIAYEIDEPQHYKYGELRDECKNREYYITSKLKCKLVRIKV